jgi:hypothetical protein
MINSEVMALIIYLKIIAAAVHILAPPGAVEGQIPPRNKWTVIAALCVGFAVFLGMMLLGAEPVTCLDPLRPYLEEPDAAQYGRRSHHVRGVDGVDDSRQFPATDLRPPADSADQEPGSPKWWVGLSLRGSAMSEVTA